MVISAMKVVGIPDMEPSQLVLRDRKCKPAVVTEEGAMFIFNVSACGTTRKVRELVLLYSMHSLDLCYSRWCQSTGHQLPNFQERTKVMGYWALYFRGRVAGLPY